MTTLQCENCKHTWTWKHPVTRDAFYFLKSKGKVLVCPVCRHAKIRQVK